MCYYNHILKTSLDDSNLSDISTAALPNIKYENH